MCCLPLHELQGQGHLLRVLDVAHIKQGEGIGQGRNWGGDVVIHYDLIHSNLELLVTLNRPQKINELEITHPHKQELL